MCRLAYSGTCSDLGICIPEYMGYIGSNRSKPFFWGARASEECEGRQGGCRYAYLGRIQRVSWRAQAAKGQIHAFALYRIVSQCILVALIGIHLDTHVSRMYRVCIAEVVS